MKKALKRILLLTFTLGLLLGLVFAISAFAEDEAPAVEYIVPEEAKDATFVLFDAKTGDYVYHANHFVADGAVLDENGVNLNDNIFDGVDYAHNISSNSYYILMQKNYEVPKMWTKNTAGELSQTASFWNFFTRYPKYVIDLGGNTMTFSMTFGAQAKGDEGAVLDFTFKNGTIVNNGAHLFNFFVHNANRTANIAFEDITFGIAEGKTPGYLISDNGAAERDQKLVVNMTFKGCTFDTTNYAKATCVCTLGVSSGNITNNLQFIDCKVTGTNQGFFAPTYTYDAEGSSVTFTSTTNDSLTTPYGIIPSDYASTEDYPFVMFNLATHAVIWKGAHWGGETDTNGVPDGLMMAITQNSAKNTATLLRRDYATTSAAKTQYNNQGNMYGTHIIDLGSHTVTSAYSGYFFREQLKGNVANELFLTVKNGTFDLQTAQLLSIFATSYCRVKTDEETGYMFDPDSTTLYKKGDAAPGTDASNDTPVYYFTNSSKKNMSYLFENIKFTNIKSDGTLVRDDKVNAESINADIRFKNCDIDYSTKRSAPLFNLGQSADKNSVGFYKSSKAFSTTYGSGYTSPAGVKESCAAVNIHITMEGGSITNLYDTTITPIAAIKYYKDMKTVEFEKGENGYLVIKTNLSDTLQQAAPEQYFFVDDGMTGIFALDEKTETQSIYAFARKIEYGYLPGIYAKNPDEHPILIFDLASGTLETSMLRWGGIEGDWGDADSDPNNALHYLVTNTVYESNPKSYVLYLQKDLTTTGYNNFGKTKGNHIVDLNGHTLTLGHHMYRMHAKTSPDALTILTKNGTVNIENVGTKNAAIVAIGSGSSGKSTGKVSSFTFENMIFENLTTTSSSNQGRLVTDYGIGGADEITVNTDFINCTVNPAASYTGELFALGMNDYSPNFTVNVTYKGGSINYAGDTVPAPFQHKNVETNANKSVTFLPDDSGSYTTVTAKEGVDASTVTYNTEDGTYYLRQISLADGIVTYKLSDFGFIKAYLNLADDINMMYRVFLPAASNPRMTFTVDGFVSVAESCGKDENGLFLFKLPSITPAQMGETIQACVSVNDAEFVFEETFEYSIDAYLTALKAQYAADETLMALVAALETYGFEAEQYEAQSTEPSNGYDAIPEPSYSLVKNEENITAKYDEGADVKMQFAMNLRGSFFLRLGITLPTGIDMTNVKLTATKDGQTKEYSLASYAADGSMIVINYEGISAIELDQDIEFVLTDDGVQIATLTFSANDYLCTASNSADANLVDLARAIYYYGVAAETYAAKLANS